MSEIMGELIQMNAHMVMRGHDKALLSIGIVVAAVMLLTSAVAFLQKDKKQGFICLGIMVVAVVAAIVANNQPRVKEIRACANGPISLEQVSGVYEIRNIDGKELTLWEK